MDILFSQTSGRSNGTDGTKLHGHFAIQESKRAQNHVQVTCTITVCSSFFLFQFYFTPGNPSLGNSSVKSSSASFF